MAYWPVVLTIWVAWMKLLRNKDQIRKKVRSKTSLMEIEKWWLVCLVTWPMGPKRRSQNAREIYQWLTSQYQRHKQKVNCALPFSSTSTFCGRAHFNLLVSPMLSFQLLSIELVVEFRFKLPRYLLKVPPVRQTLEPKGGHWSGWTQTVTTVDARLAQCIVLYSLYRVKCAVDSVKCKVYSVKCKVYSV